MQTQSDPGSSVELDLHNIAAHYRDIKAGTQSAGQGMLMFSQESEGERAYALRPDVPTAIDTWMIAAGSGQPLAATHPDTGKTYSPAKRLVDKDFPLEPGAVTKTDLGLKGTPREVTANAAVSAQHNEAIRHLSMNTIGHVSHDQFGQPVHLPASHIQETVWTETRRQAGWDSAWNAEQREQTHQAKVTSRDAARAERERAKSERTLF